ncbi:hypothetical protein ALI22I_40960 [Saccharothrix sp. ALI-22-I]|uniref:DUF4349 domain-containing protein n=1 Tax=Saccharothrix sp. ALI-22-I TaxID=1933778 RepID=UPI00097C2AB2|nr:DUF4349 domain-containing protein [Saccharothrix sp. ALI-22-I]ONI82452.1 hypothetical protein ALI22I_40960 [Saccharothrix sp. ALI-22-I]
MGRQVGVAGFAVTALAVLALAGCSSTMSSSGSADSGQPAGQLANAPVDQPGVAPPKLEAAGEGQQAGTSAQQNRQLVRTATMDLRAADVTGVLRDVKGLVLAEGGYSAQEKSQLDHATVTLHVPGDKLEAVLESIGGLGGVEVNQRELRTEDVTEQVVDIEVRIANQRASVERVRGLLDRASSTSEITQIEAELTKRQSELESLQRRYETLKGQVAMSTLTVTITSQGAPVPVVEEEKAGFLDALAGGWGALVTAFGWLMVVVGAVLPFAVVLGVPTWVYLWWRRRRKSEVVPAATGSGTP